MGGELGRGEVIEIELDSDQYRTAYEVGRLRHFRVIASGRRNAHGLIADRYTSIKLNAIGCCGEIAVRVLVDEPWWQLPVDTYKSKPDIPPNIDVTTRTRRNYELLIRPGDPIDRVAYLVIHIPGSRVCRVMGYIPVARAMKTKWLRTWGDRAPAYFVPTEKLNQKLELG